MVEQKCKNCKNVFECDENETGWKLICRACYVISKSQDMKDKKVNTELENGVGSNPDATFGMIFNNAVQLAKFEMESAEVRGMARFREEFAECFETLWDLMVAERHKRFGLD